MSVVSVICSTALFVWFIVTLSPLFRHYLTRDLSTHPGFLHLTLYLSLLSYYSSKLFVTRVILTGTKSFQIFNCRFKSKKTCDLLDLSISKCTVIIYISLCTFIATLSRSIYHFSPLFLSQVILIKRSICSSRFNSFCSRWHEEEILSLKRENIWYLTVYREAKLSASALNGDNVYRRSVELHLLIKTVIWTQFCRRFVYSDSRAIT